MVGRSQGDTNVQYNMIVFLVSIMSSPVHTRYVRSARYTTQVVDNIIVMQYRKSTFKDPFHIPIELIKSFLKLS